MRILYFLRSSDWGFQQLQDSKDMIPVSTTFRTRMISTASQTCKPAARGIDRSSTSGEVTKEHQMSMDLTTRSFSTRKSFWKSLNPIIQLIRYSCSMPRMWLTALSKYLKSTMTSLTSWRTTKAFAASRRWKTSIQLIQITRSWNTDAAGSTQPWSWSWMKSLGISPMPCKRRRGASQSQKRRCFSRKQHRGSSIAMFDRGYWYILCPKWRMWF